MARIPYLFTDLIQTYKRKRNQEALEAPDSSSRVYRFFLLFLAFPPLLLLIIGKPVWTIVAYAIIGAFFMPFLAAMLLVMNNRTGWVGGLRNGWATNFVLALSLLVFGYLCYGEIIDVLN